jgi:hypothetical protein
MNNFFLRFMEWVMRVLEFWFDYYLSMLAVFHFRAQGEL